MFREFQEIFSWLRCNVATMILPRGRKKKKNVKKKKSFWLFPPSIGKPSIDRFFPTNNVKNNTPQK